MSEKVGKIEIVIKGGQPWGFRLQAKAENRSVVIVDEIVRGGRADQQGELKVGDHVIKINGIQCLSLADALQLIDSAFRTLTIVVWRTNNFISKDKSKDYFDTVHQFDQLPNYASCQSHSNPQTSSIYENVNFRFQEEKQRDRRFSPVENVNHFNNKYISATSSQQLPCNNTKVYSGRNDYYKNNFKTPFSCLDKTFKNEPEKKAMSVYNPERKLHSKTQRDLHQYCNVQPLPALNYMPEINKYEQRHFSKTAKEISPHNNVHSVNDSSYGKIFNISESSDLTPVSTIAVQENSMPISNQSMRQYSVNNMLGKTKVSDKPHCCRYPNCHNKYLNCKIHSPPERDVSYPVTHSFQNDYENIDFISQPNFTYKDQSNCGSLNYEQNVEEPILNCLPFGNKKKPSDSKTLKFEKDAVPSNISDFPVINSSINPSNYKLKESVNGNIPKGISETHGQSLVGNSDSSLKWEKDSAPSNACGFPVIRLLTNPNGKIEESINDIIPNTTLGTRAKTQDGNSMPSLTWEKDYVPSNSCDIPVIKSLTKPPNYKLEESGNIIITKTSDTHTKSVGGNSVSSLCHFSSSDYEEKVAYQDKAHDSFCKDSDIFQYKTEHGQIKSILQSEELASKCLYSNPCDFPVINSSNNSPNYNLEESVNDITPKTTSDDHTKSVVGNSVSSLCHFSNNVYKEKDNYLSKAGESTHQIEDSNIFQYKSVYGQIKPSSYNVQEKESATECLYSSSSKPSFDKRIFSSVNNTSFIKENDVFFDASNNSMCMISKEAAVVKLISSRPQQIYIDEDDELKEIDENKNKTAAVFSPISVSPPLPSPPPENDLEILPCNEPLPSPPLFVSEQKQNNGNKMVETIYANLEMLKIQYSVVSSSETSSSNGKHSVKYSSNAGDVATNISYAENTYHPVRSEMTLIPDLQTKPLVSAPFLEKVFQNQEEKIWRKVLNLPFNSAYFTTSVPKAKLLTRYTSKLHTNKMSEVKELSNEKEELIASLRKKLDILLEEEAALQDELRQNEELGSCLSVKLGSTATQNELKKFSNHVQELEKITNLLLSLSGRLARTKNALLILPSNASAEEKMLLETKYKKLTQQYEEALHLQKDIDNRNKQVLFYLQKYLTKDELADYNHFIKMKVKLLVDYKELVEKINLGEEQLKELTNS